MMPTALTNLSPVFFETIGVFGFGLYVLNYSLLSLGKLTSASKLYFAINLVAASAVLVGLVHSFNLASALIQSFWIIISLVALIVRRRPTGHSTILA